MHRRQLPVLEPCGEDFSAMARDGTRRQCQRCQTAVHELSAMTEAEARLFLLRSQGQTRCVRYDVRADGTVRFRSPPARTAGAVVAALAGAVAACTSTSPAVELPPVDGIAWNDDGSTTIPPAGERRSVGEIGEIGEIAGGVIGSIKGSVMGAMVVPDAECVAAPPSPLPLVARRSPDEDRRRPRARPKRSRAERKAERRERRRQRKAERKARQTRQREAKQARREYEQAVNEAEREVRRQTRRAERQRRRAERRVERARRRAERRVERQRRRTERRAQRAERRQRRHRRD